MYLLPGKGYASKTQYTHELRTLHFSNLTFAQVCITLITIIYCHTTRNRVAKTQYIYTQLHENSIFAHFCYTFSNLTFSQVCITLITIINCHTTLNMISTDVLSNITGIYMYKSLSVGTNAL